MFVFLCSSILYINSYNKKILIGKQILPLFYGFQKGGNYSINFTNGNNDYLVLIGTPFEIKEYERIEKIAKFNMTFDFYSPCNIIDTYKFNYYHIIKNGHGYATGLIEKEGIYQTLITSCTYFSSAITFDIQYMNPNSTLSSTIQPYLKVYPLIIITTMILFLIWIINWLSYFTFTNKLHLFLSLFLLFNLIDKITTYYELYLRNKSDSLVYISNISKLIHSIKIFSFVFFMTMTFSGYDICYEKVNIFLTFLPSFIVSFCYSISCYYLKYYFKDETLDAVFILFLLISNYITFVIVGGSIKSGNQMNFLKNILFVVLYVHNIISTLNEFNFFITRFNYSFSILLVFNIFELIFIVFCEIQLKMTKETLTNYIDIGGKATIMKRMNIYGLKQKTFHIPPEIIEISDGAFKGNKTIQKVDLPANSKLKKIGVEAFKTSSIEQISIPSSVSSIGKMAFDGCDKLQTIEFIEKSQIKFFDSFVFSNLMIEELTIPSSLIDVKTLWCKSSPNIKKIKISSNNEFFYNFENSFIVQRIIKNDFEVIIFAMRNIKTVFIPSFIKMIQSCSFELCSSLQKVEFSKDSQLLSIGNFSFSKSSIEYIEIPESVRVIDDTAFLRCEKLRKVVFGQNSKLEIIGKGAFAGNKSLISFEIPSQVYSIGNNAFMQSSNLRFVEIKEDSKLVSFSIELFEECPNVSVFAPHEIMLKLFS